MVKNIVPRHSKSRIGMGLPLESQADLNIVIIGGGVSGAATLACLFSRRGELSGYRPHIHLIDPRGFDGTGIAYSPPRDKPSEIMDAWRGLRITVRGERMLGRNAPQQGFDFARWIQSRSEGYSARDYVPRYLFGEFMRDTTINLIKQMRAESFQITEHKQRVTAIQEKGKDLPFTLTVNCTDNVTIPRADYIFIGLGPQRKFDLSEHLKGHFGYYPTPYNMPYDGGFAQKNKADYKLVLYGGYATILDAIVIAEKLGYKDQYTIISGAANKLRGMPADEMPNHEQFCSLRDGNGNRFKFIFGYVNENGIIFDLDQRVFSIPFWNGKVTTKPQARITAANIVNCSLWEKTLERSQGYGKKCVAVSCHRTDQFANELLERMRKQRMITLSSAGVFANHPSLALVGDPALFTAGTAEAWKAQHCWNSAEEAVARFSRQLKRDSFRFAMAPR